MEVGAQDVREVSVDHDGAVHLAQLEETVGREGDVEREAVVARGEDVLGVADAYQGAEVPGDDHVECGSDRLSGCREPDSLVHSLFDLILIQCAAPCLLEVQSQSGLYFLTDRDVRRTGF